MEKKIVIKEIDRLTSTVHSGKVVSEYLIYYMVDDVKVDAYTEIGNESKEFRVHDLLTEYFVGDNNDKASVESVIEEISFEELHTN